jgi:hypothetical protein
MMVRDNEDRVVQLLQSINSAVGGEQKTVFEGQGVSAGATALNPRTYVVNETDDLDGVQPGGTVTLQPGDEKTLVRAEAASDAGIACLAVGANDQSDVRYKLIVDNQQTVGGTTNSPLGLLNSPFSFIETLGAIVPAERNIKYVAERPSSASGSVDLAARMHVENLSV